MRADIYSHKVGVVYIALWLLSWWWCMGLRGPAPGLMEGPAR